MGIRARGHHPPPETNHPRASPRARGPWPARLNDAYDQAGITGILVLAAQSTRSSRRILSAREPAGLVLGLTAPWDGLTLLPRPYAA